MAIKYLSHLETLNIDLQGNQLLNAVVHPDITANRPTAPNAGQLFFNTSTSELEVYDGTNWVSAAGDITAVLAGDGITGGGNSGSVTLAVDYTNSATNVVSAAPTGTPSASSTVLFAATGGVSKVAFNNIDISLFNNDANYSTTVGTVTSVGASGSGGVTISGSPVTTSGVLNIGLSNVPNSSLANSSITVTAGKGLKTGGTVSLGGTVQVDVDYAGAANVILDTGNKVGTAVETDWNILVSDGTMAAEYYAVGDLPFAPAGTVTGVTSVAIAGTDGIDVDSGSPITGAGTITLGLSNVPNSSLANDDVTFGSTTVALGGTSTSIAGLTALDFAAGNRTIGASIGANSLTLASSSSTVVIPGNLTVSGTTTTIDSNTVNIGDNIITLNADETGTPSQNAGIEIERGTEANKSLLWDETNNVWTVGSESFTANTFNGALNGNASTASKWQSSRTVTFATGDVTGSFSIDGSANVNNVNLTVTGVSANSIALGTDTTGNYVATASGSNGITVSGSGSETAAITISGVNASTTAKGVVELANSTETITGTDTTRAVTPKGASDLVANRIDKHRFTDTIPAGNPVHTVPHTFGTTFGVSGVVPIMVSYFDVATGDQLMIDTVQISKDEFEARLAAPHGADILISVIYAG
jgi:hypothetical protein